MIRTGILDLLDRSAFEHLVAFFLTTHYRCIPMSCNEDRQLRRRPPPLLPLPWQSGKQKTMARNHGSLHWRRFYAKGTSTNICSSPSGSRKLSTISFLCRWTRVTSHFATHASSHLESIWCDWQLSKETRVVPRDTQVKLDAVVRAHGDPVTVLNLELGVIIGGIQDKVWCSPL